MAEQNERAFQKQPTVVLYSKLKSKKSKKPLRYTRNVGLGFKTPREVHLSLFLLFFLQILQTWKFSWCCIELYLYNFSFIGF